MSALIADFHFMRPAWLLLFVPLGYLSWRLWRHDPGTAFWQRICDAALLPYVVVDTGGRSRRRSVGPFVLVGGLSILALAGPTYERAPQPVYRDEAALVILLDLSTSMLATDIKPTRLDRARFKIKDLLANRLTGQTALVVFAAQPFTVTPLTDDVATINSQLAILSPELMPRQGNNVPLAINKGVELLTQAGFLRGELLLITDNLPASAVARAGDVLKGRYHLSVLGIASVTGSPIPLPEGGFATDQAGAIVLSKLTPTTLAELAHGAGGIYQTVTANGADVTAFTAQFRAAAEHSDALATEHKAAEWNELGPWLLLPAVLAAALAFRRGALVMVLLACGLALERPAAAAWWLTPDQAGQRTFEAGDFASAAQTFHAPAWRAASQYRAGQFAEMLETLGTPTNATDSYNRGNALARLGRFEEAIGEYERALKLAPGLEDAAHNRDLLREIVNRQHQNDEPQTDEERAQQEREKQRQAQGQDQGENGEQGEGEAQARDAGRDTQMRPPSPNDEPAESEQAQEAGKRERSQGQSEAQNANGADTQAAEEKQPSEEAAELTAEGDEETKMATEQWLRQIPDDPGGLLRRKFQYQYGRLYGDEPEDAEPW